MLEPAGDEDQYHSTHEALSSPGCQLLLHLRYVDLDLLAAAESCQSCAMIRTSPWAEPGSNGEDS